MIFTTLFTESATVLNPLFEPLLPVIYFTSMTAKKRKAAGSVSSEPSIPSDSPPFESALSELETIVEQLERDDLTLDTALTHFERGIHLMRTCDAHLNHVRGRITELLRGENGAFAEKVLGTSLQSFLEEENSDG